MKSPKLGSDRSVAYAVLLSLLLIVPCLCTASTFKTVHKFQGPDGAGPGPDLVFDAAGNLYGVTIAGGDMTCGWATPSGCGTIFKLDPSGMFTVVHTFEFEIISGWDTGAGFPIGGVAIDAAGDFYGVLAGGPNNWCDDVGPYSLNSCGAVFKVDSAGNETDNNLDFRNSDPEASLIWDAAGNLYGTAMNGCGTGDPPGAWGTVFKVDPSSLNFTTSFAFDVGDGPGPNSPMARMVDAPRAP